MDTTVELFKKAISGEVIASSFYSLASEVTKNDEARMVFLNLSTMEDDHAQELVKQCQKVFDPSEFDAQAFLNDLIKKDSGIDKITSDTIENGSPAEVLELAISLENAAKETYDKLSMQVKDPEMKKYCQGLSDEEASHALELTNTLNSLDMDMEDRPGL
ncbi:MAG: ferritin family protein [Magnetococcales bacterium]|nr:ferritin family protein [Magnetococcales bacterium]